MAVLKGGGSQPANDSIHIWTECPAGHHICVTRYWIDRVGSAQATKTAVDNCTRCRIKRV